MEIQNGKGGNLEWDRQGGHLPCCITRKVGEDIGQLVVGRWRHFILIAPIFSIKYKARPSTYRDNKELRERES